MGQGLKPVAGCSTAAERCRTCLQSRLHSLIAASFRPILTSYQALTAATEHTKCMRGIHLTTTSMLHSKFTSQCTSQPYGEPAVFSPRERPHKGPVNGLVTIVKRHSKALSAIGEKDRSSSSPYMSHDCHCLLSCDLTSSDITCHELALCLCSGIDYLDESYALAHRIMSNLCDLVEKFPEPAAAAQMSQ